MRANFFLLILFLLNAGASPALAAPAAELQRITGEVWVYSATQRAKPVKAGAAIESGMSIVTGPNGSALIRFEDGQMVFLRSESVFRVKAFEFANSAGSGDRISLELVRGGMRAITGTIGERNPDAWKLETPAATTGISGTDFSAVVQNGVYAHVNVGSITLTNSGGATSVASGQTAFVANAAVAPVVTSAVPSGMFEELDASAVNVRPGGAAAGAGNVASATPTLKTGAVVIGIGVGAAALVALGGGGSGSTTHH